jgi:NAD(P)-dependent dehydrogenase (short-subunit alcohol dehydrogenase family)/rhamnose utilization protein RhaD (predicted bifunctional aldolase and dehydrogenase)
MKDPLSQLVEISNFYGRQKEYVIAGGGNTSYKDEKILYVKASGVSLGAIEESGFVALDRGLLGSMKTKSYSTDERERENEVKSDLLKSRIYPEKNQRPSVEASVHESIRYPFVVHLHPTIVNGLTCAKDALKSCNQLFGDEVVFLNYITPGYILFKTIEEQNKDYYSRNGRYPKVFILQNHGIFVGGETIEDIKSSYDLIIHSIEEKIGDGFSYSDLQIDENVVDILPGIRAALSREQLIVCQIRNNDLIQKYARDEQVFSKIAKPFTPDGIVYCNPYPLYVGTKDNGELVLEEFVSELEQYRALHKYDPKIVLIKDLGLVSTGENMNMAKTRLDVFEDILRIADYTESFGGPNPMYDEDIKFIEQWEVEAYRKKLMSTGEIGKVQNKIAIVTGGAQGFGKGIVKGLAAEGAHVIVLDINEDKGREFVDSLKVDYPLIKSAFIKTDITDNDSIQNAVTQVVRKFGGVDILISNAGVLYAGGLDELDEKQFDLVTEVNYKGFYLCVKYFSLPMKLQAKYNEDLFSDIIQINSKSGLQGSNKNFAYAGGKFGGIGLAQSFAMELIQYRIKVNAICPGNFFEGPLWDDPETGLFVQYLKAGKVPGAQNITDVKKFYEEKVPMKRGCYPGDVVNAILYIIDQCYETGQAVPVTGGQVMLH